MPIDLRKYIEKGTYLGYIEELDYMERFAVINSPKLEKLYFTFSAELSLMDLRDAEIIYKRDPASSDSLAEDLKNSIVPDLKPNDTIYYVINGGIVEKVDVKKDQKKRIEYTNKYPDFLQGELKYVPQNLKSKEIISCRDVVACGQVVKKLDDKIIVDAGVSIFIDIERRKRWSWSDRKLVDEKTFELGDWLAVEFYSIEFIDPSLL